MMRPAHRLAPRRAVADDGAKLALVEHFLSSEDRTQVATRAVGWLADLGVRHVVVLGVEETKGILLPLAASGMNRRRLDALMVPVDERHDPIVVALFAQQPVLFPRGLRVLAPLSTPLWAVPLRSDAVDEAEGLLLVDVEGTALREDVRWLAQVLGEKLARLRNGERLAARRFERERTLLRAIIDAVTDPILLTDNEGRVLEANSRAEKLLVAPENASEGWRRAVGLNTTLFSAALASRAMEHLGAARREVLLVDPNDGSDLLFELLSTPVDPRSADGGGAVVSILRNVTDLGRAMAEIEEHRRKLRVAEAEVHGERHRLDLIIDSVADPIVVTDADGETLMMNSPAERLFTADGHGLEAQRRVRANEAHFSSFVSNLLFSAGGMRHRGEINLVDPHAGASVPFEAVAGKVLSEKGELDAVVTILHDRTEAIEKAKLFEQVKQAADQLELRVQTATADLAKQNELLRRQALELEQASQLKSQFLANMSHELRTPLNAILGYTNMLLQGVSGALAAPQRRSLLRVDSNGRHLLTIINEILDITRIESGRMPLHLGGFHLRELVVEVMAELEPIIARSKLAVSTLVPEELVPMRSDRQKVKQIVLNLLSNALKFTHSGWVKVTATPITRGKVVRIAVADSGIGISADNHEKVFEDFQQVDNSPTRAYGGTGLGLSICRRLAVMLGGRIMLESQLGHGSTFTLEVPMRLKRK